MNRHSSVPGGPAGADAGPAPGGTAATVSAWRAGMHTASTVPDVWRRTEEEEENLFKVLYGPLPPPPPPSPSASTFSWPPTEEEEVEIERVLYAPRRWRRLPVFEQVCPEK